MKLLDQARQNPVLRWSALVALLVGLTQFNTGLKLVYSKWTADEAAAEAKKEATVAKETATQAKDVAVGVDEKFNHYLDTQQKVADALNSYVAQQKQMQQAPNQSDPAIREWRDPDTGQWWCCPERSGCERDDDWYRC